MTKNGMLSIRGPTAATRFVLLQGDAIRDRHRSPSRLRSGERLALAPEAQEAEELVRELLG